MKNNKKEFHFDMSVTSSNGCIEHKVFVVETKTLSAALKKVEKYNKLSHSSVHIGELIEVKEIVA